MFRTEGSVGPAIWLIVNRQLPTLTSMSKITRKKHSVPAKAPPRLEEVVEDLEAIEEMGRQLKKQLARIAKLREELEADPTSEGAKVMRRPLNEHYDVAAKLLNTLNDSKWASIVLRAELNRGERGPTFDDPEKLRKYLAAK